MKVTKKAYKALEKSIKVWEKAHKVLLKIKGKVNDGIVVHSNLECPLCVLFNRNVIETKEDCIGCPIFEKTKRRYCRRAPFTKWVRYGHCGKKIGIGAINAHAAMIKFMKGLLKKCEVNEN